MKRYAFITLISSDHHYIFIFSNNPTLDIGQIEGAFVFGLGYHLTEEMKYDPKTGATLTNSTWVSGDWCVLQLSVDMVQKTKWSILCG